MKTTYLTQKKYLDDEALVLESVEHGYQCKLFVVILFFLSACSYTGKDFVLPDTKNLPRLQPGDIITVKYVQVSENGVPISPQFHGRRVDMSWEELLSKKSLAAPRYTVSKGKGRNLPVSCSGCRYFYLLLCLPFRKLIQRDEFRINKAAMFTNTELSLPFTVQLNMHLNTECINESVSRVAKEVEEVF